MTDEVAALTADEARRMTASALERAAKACGKPCMAWVRASIEDRARQGGMSVILNVENYLKGIGEKWNAPAFIEMSSRMIQEDLKSKGYEVKIVDVWNVLEVSWRKG